MAEKENDTVRHARYWERKMRNSLIMEKLMPYAIVTGTLAAFLVLGYIEVGL